jgi:hypothetical protein
MKVELEPKYFLKVKMQFLLIPKVIDSEERTMIQNTMEKGL